MPTFCPHCHKLVAEQPVCANCGKRLAIAGPDDPAVDRAVMLHLIRYVLGWVFGVVGIGLLCMVLLYIFLT